MSWRRRSKAQWAGSAVFLSGSLLTDKRTTHSVHQGTQRRQERPTEPPGGRTGDYGANHDQPIDVFEGVAGQHSLADGGVREAE